MILYMISSDYISLKAGTGGVHGAPLGSTDLAHVKQIFSFNPEEV